MDSETTTVQGEEREALRRHRLLERARKAKVAKAKAAERSRPRRLREVERKMTEVGKAIRETPIGERWPLYQELRELANERINLKYGGER